jgi:hypothetical protein
MPIYMDKNSFTIKGITLPCIQTAATMRLLGLRSIREWGSKLWKRGCEPYINASTHYVQPTEARDGDVMG